MKAFFLISLLSLAILPSVAAADNFLGLPVMQDGRVDVKTDARFEMTVSLSHDDVLAFYRDALKDRKDIKFRNWKDATYIEDDGSLPWHSITISKPDGQAPVTVTIVKDNWTWIMGTLLLRYVGVFVVLMILFLAMSVAGRIISRSIERLEAGKAG
jgi:hypothetical protein